MDWMNNAPISANYSHSTMTSWFYWAYNPDSGGAPPTLPHVVLVREYCRRRALLREGPRLKE